MKLAAVQAIASLIDENEITEDYIIPDALDDRVVNAVAQAVTEAAIDSGVSVLFQPVLKTN